MGMHWLLSYASNMESYLSRLWRACVSRLGSWVEGYTGVTLSLTGILGLAAFLYGLYHYRLLRTGPRKRDEEVFDPNQPSTSAAGPAAAAATAATGAAKPAQQPRAQQQPSAIAAAAPAPAPPALRLGGAASLTISVPGVLLEESTAAQLEESATVLPAAAGVLRELLSSGARGSAVYLLAHVEGDIGEAVVRGALEHAGLVGTALGQLPPHRLLFCGTAEGKVSVVRQIEPDLHFDAQPETVRELQRFMKRLVYVAAPAGAGAGGEAQAAAACLPGAANVQRVASFAGFFGR